MRFPSRIFFLTFGILLYSLTANAGDKSLRAYDMDMAKEICGGLPLEDVEGVWIYPEDKVTVLVLNDGKQPDGGLASYTVSVVETSDARLKPGEVIGKLTATSEERVYKIELSTEKKNDLLLKPKAVMATLSKDGDSFSFKRQKSPLKARLNFNFSRLLPGFWKMISTGISSSGNSSVSLPVGMVKIFPSYDGNGSSRRKARYL